MMSKDMYAFVFIFREYILSEYLVVRVERKLIHLIDSLSSLHNEMQCFENTEMQMRIKWEWNGLLEIMYPNRLWKFITWSIVKMLRQMWKCEMFNCENALIGHENELKKLYAARNIHDENNSKSSRQQLRHRVLRYAERCISEIYRMMYFWNMQHNFVDHLGSSRHALSNEPLIIKISVATSENGPSNVLGV